MKNLKVEKYYKIPMKLDLSECKRINEVPFSLVENYVKFFNFFLPRNISEVIVIIPKNKMSESEVIGHAIRKIRNIDNIKIILLSDKITNKFILCLK
ncbi:DUF4898 domain-containing protein [Acidianus infernus]|uniref:DUF4898 domain-containing protein n=1 Tax=Acidianus infernus TaxID=12915 RepID=A0A6A9QHA2_ACIIN|nr:DUF4898 domain-containing protein [Acidianus infernus]MUM65695.1 DUF4898 domain-containing protein [Acidianus infernus]